jgi:shikimate dehydrogenase
MHNAAFNAAGINAAYCAFEPSSIEAGVKAIRSLGIKGASITIPFKIDVLSWIDEPDKMSAAIGSANTLLNKDNKIYAYNTDGLGALKAIEYAGIDINFKRILIIGNGGSARAIAVTLATHGARIIIAGRNPSRTRALSEYINNLGFESASADIYECSRDMLSEIDIVINTTPVGMNPDQHLSPIDPALLSNKNTVFDIVYAPDMTRLLLEADKAGSQIIKGIEMLVYQGAEQFKIWTGTDAPIDEIRKSLKTALART